MEIKVKRGKKSLKGNELQFKNELELNLKRE
jgi:hypothetical protein